MNAAARIDLGLRPLDREAFREFGDVIETADRKSFAINAGTTRRFDDLAAVDVGDRGGRPLISIFRGTPIPPPIRIAIMERHPLGSQAFVPMERAPFLVVVAPPGEAVAPEDICAFVTNGRQGINYRRGVWHHPLLVLDTETDFLVVDRGGTGENCDAFHFDSATTILLDPGAR